MVLQLATSRSDTLAIDRQTQVMTNAVREAVAAISNDQEASTDWDDAVVRVHARPLDMAWLDNNLGVWFNTFYHHDETYLLDPSDGPVYAMQAGKRADAATFSWIAQRVLPLAATLRASMREAAADTGRADGHTPGQSQISVLNGRPAVISLKPIVTETGAYPQPPGTEYIHVSIRYLDASFLQALADRYSVGKPHFSWTPQGAARLPLRDAAGTPIGYISWRPFEPGSQVKQRLIPALFLALLLIGGLAASLLLRNWRSRNDLEASRAQAQHLAFHDPLTGLPNRALFDDRLGFALRRTRDSSGLAVLLLDLDRFKNVNDTYGHQVGDALIRDFGNRFSSLLREGDTVARLGGDEFAIIIEESTQADVEQLCRRLLLAVQQPFAGPGSQAHVGVSIGVAMAPASSNDSTELTRQADIALYRAKAEGRNTFRVFHSEMDDSVRLRSSIEQDLRQALSTGRGLAMHFQPIVGGDGATIIGLEALIRWNEARRGAIAPQVFLSVAEESGLMAPLGEWVLREACRVAASRPNLLIAINLSPIQFKLPGFDQRVMQIVEHAGVHPDQIQLEITEHVLLADETSVQNALVRLREAGFVIALDDFGTGYSSLSHLRKFSVDKIKIDQSFVRSLGTADDSSTIVTAVLALGQAMGLKVTAEGVETRRQREFLAAGGCTEMQGFLFSGSVPENELDQLLATLPGAMRAA
ncbi:MAG: EAL domain-containing protein [Croceibacterium sp.]